MEKHILAIDQGTTSSRAILFSSSGEKIAEHQVGFEQYYPEKAWVEHDPNQIWSTVLECCQQTVEKARVPPESIAGIGISNQRETTIIWNRETGEPIYPAIVWQDRRTAEVCKALAQDASICDTISAKTGLLIDSYFSATKIRWILDHVDGAEALAEQGKLAFGTVDTFLVWRLTGGKVHATDATNASRTMLFNLKTQSWDDELLDIFGVPKSLLPEVKDCVADFGEMNAEILGCAIPIQGVAGDQQAALIGQACFKAGMMKSTYGTGCFVLLNTGETIVHSQNKLLTTVAYRINGKVCYGLEGSIFIAGAAIKWLRDQLHLIKSAKETEALVASVKDNGGVYFVPALTGLGAPYWDPHARGVISGLTRGTGAAHIVRAALEAVCYQTRDLMEAMQADYEHHVKILRVDGGMAENDWLMQFLSDMLNLPIDRPSNIETSAQGAAYLAGLGAGIFESLEVVEKLWMQEQSFKPQMLESHKEQLLKGWQHAVKQTLIT